MVFAFGVAQHLYEANAHPRVMCSADELARLRGQVGDGPGKHLLDALREKVRPTIDAALSVDDPASLLFPGDHTRANVHVSDFITDVALVAALDQDADAARAVAILLDAARDASARQGDDRMNVGYHGYGKYALAFDLLYHELDAAVRSRFVQWAADYSVRRVTKVLRDGHYLHHAAMNIPLDGLITSLVTLLAIQGEPDAGDLAAERDENLRYLEAAINTMLGPSGYPAEDIGYGSGMTCLVAPLVEAVRRAGLFDIYRECPRWSRFGRAMLHFLQPWGVASSNTGDYGAELGPTGFVLPRLATETADPVLLWMHSVTSYPIACAGPWGDAAASRRAYPELTVADGYKLPVECWSLFVLDDLAAPPQHPSHVGGDTAFMDADRGIVSFRSDWSEDATFLVFDGGHRSPSAQGHAHDSGGHISLSALGEYFAIDTGRYSIEQEHHNVVTVDGVSGHVGDGSWIASRYHANLTGYWPGRFVDAAAVDYSQMADCYWARRTVMLVKGDGAPAYAVTIEDVNKADDYREFWWLLNVHPDSRIDVSGDTATVTGATHGNLLDVRFVLPSPDAFPKPHTLKLEQRTQLAGSPKEYSGDAIAGDQHNAALQYRKRIGMLEYGPVFERPRLDARIAGYNGRFMSLMLPRHRDAPAASVRRLDTHENALAAQVSHGNVTDTIIWAYEHRLLEAGDIVARGGWCVVRRDRRSGRVLAAHVHEPGRLEVAGTRLRVAGSLQP